MNAERSGPYAMGLDQNPANYEALSPLSFLPRAARTYPNRTAWIHGDRQINYADFYAMNTRAGGEVVPDN